VELLASTMIPPSVFALSSLFTELFSWFPKRYYRHTKNRPNERSVLIILYQQIHPILASLAGNVAERPEVRMAALGLLFMSNAPQSLWQKFASSTWFEPNRQFASFTHSLIGSMVNMPPSVPFFEEL
jgi:hypothetical protein